MLGEPTWPPVDQAPPSPDLLEITGGDELLARLLAGRGLHDPANAAAFLDPRAYTPCDPFDLPNMSRAAQRLLLAIERGERTLVWGDFDVDGQSATALLSAGLRQLGIAEVLCHIPLRERDSHGVQLERLTPYLDQGVQLIVTCDTGITAHDALESAQARGVDVVLSDHHELPEKLPDVHAIVHPRLLPAGHPAVGLPGVGAAYLLLKAAFTLQGRPQAAEEWLDYAALGILADVAVLRGEGRYLVQRGLQRMRRSLRPGLAALAEVAGVDPAAIDDGVLGFQFIPRLNAAGRLGDAGLGLELLLTEDHSRAAVLAAQLESLNQRRKYLTQEVFETALAQIEAQPERLRAPLVLLNHPGWPAGVIGIVASRLVERFQRPFLLVATPPGETGRGSARSVEGVNITAALASQAHLLEGYGGHPMAAGFGVRPENIEALRSGLGRAAVLPAERPQLQPDAELPIALASPEVAVSLERLAPFGNANPAPLLVARRLRLKKAERTRSGESLRMQVLDEAGQEFSVMWWQGVGWPQPEGVFDLLYSLRADRRDPGKGVLLEWSDFRSVEGPPVKAAVPALRIDDRRGEVYPEKALAQLIAEYPGAIVFGEGMRPPEAKVKFSDRLLLERAACLILWSAPPSPAELRSILRAVRPQELVLMAQPNPYDQPQAFLQQLGGMVKYALRQQAGQVSITRLAAVLGQRLVTMHTSLRWLEAAGHIGLQVTADADVLSLSAGGSAASPAEQRAVRNNLTALLAETAAFRGFLRNAALESLAEYFTG